MSAPDCSTRPNRGKEQPGEPLGAACDLGATKHLHGRERARAADKDRE